MPISIQTDIIKEIASELEMGMLVFYNVSTGILVSYPDETSHPYFEPSEWRKEINTIKKDRKKYLKFEPMDTGQAIRMMHKFAADIDNKKTRENIEEILNNRKPFQAFKQSLRQIPDLQKSWYQYKTAGYIQWVQDQVEGHNFET